MDEKENSMSRPKLSSAEAVVRAFYALSAYERDQVAFAIRTNKYANPSGIAAEVPRRVSKKKDPVPSLLGTIKSNVSP
jgi:hypothetical protein